MTIQELHDTTNRIVKIHIDYGDWTTELNRENPLELHAYGNYQIAQLDPTGCGEITVFVKMIPATN